jgi:hypothetical protein
MTSRKGFGRKQSWTNGGTILKRMRRIMRTSVRILDAPVEIRIEYLPNTTGKPAQLISFLEH